MDQNNSLPPYAQGLASPQVKKKNDLIRNCDLNCFVKVSAVSCLSSLGFCLQI